MRLAKCALAALLVSAVVADVPSLAARAAGDWPGWRGPRRDGISTDTNLLTAWPQNGPPLVWTARGLGQGFSSVAVTGGRVFTMGDRRDGQYVIALEEATGKELWATRVGGRHDDEFAGPRATPTVDADLLFVVTTSGDVVSLESASGKERWRRSLPRDFGGRMMSQWMFAESPLVDGDRVIVTPGAQQASLVALDKRTGKDIWRAHMPARMGSAGADGAGYSSVVISNGGGVKQYIQLMGRGLISIRASDAYYLWTYNRVANPIANISTPVVSGNYVFASTGYAEGGSVVLQLSSDGKGGVTATEKFYMDARTLQNHHGGFVAIDGVVYGGHGQSNGFPFALELATGRMLWDRARGAGEGSAAVTAADGHLYFRYQNGVMALIAVSPKQYQLKSTFTIPPAGRTYSWSHPVITDGKLYLREQDFLYVYSIKR
jgi:outer membrane protein assembly factor BamB